MHTYQYAGNVYEENTQRAQLELKGKSENDLHGHVVEKMFPISMSKAVGQ